MVRGFKTWCEEESLRMRCALGIKQHDPLPYEALAKHLGVVPCSVNKLPLSASSKTQLLVKDTYSWSAILIPIGAMHILLVNPFISPARRTSSVTHELAHVICGHKATRFYILNEDNIKIFDYDKHQEDEADWLAGSLLLPRAALLCALRRKIPESEICGIYEVSRDLLRMRINKTGVRKQLQCG